MISWVSANWKEVLDIVAYVCFIASIIVKMTPTLKDDNFVLPIIKFIGKYLAFNTNAPVERPK
jgi:hypothetical protein